MIEVFKTISNIYDDKVTTNILTMRLNNSNMGLRGHDYTLEQKRISFFVLILHTGLYIYINQYVKIIFQIELSNYGINYQSMLLDLNP